MKLSGAILIFTAYFLAICLQCGSTGSGKGNGNTGSGITWGSPSRPPPSPAMRECMSGTPPNTDNCKSGGTKIRPEQWDKWYFYIGSKRCVPYKGHDPEDCNAKVPKKEFSSEEECKKYCQ